MSTFDPASLREVTNYFFNRREAILNNWRISCEQDSQLGKVSALSRQEFNNLAPVILDIFEQRLLGKPQLADLSYVARGHGLHRWHKALALIETMKELNHLSQVLYQELDAYSELFPQAEKSLLLFVNRTINSIMQETITGSVQKYDELQRLHAAGRLDTLQSAVESMSELSKVRGDLLRKSSHDLRGSVGIASFAASLMQMQDMKDEERQIYLEMLNRNLTNVQSMLTNLMDLSRLESGQETLHIEPVDVSVLLCELVDGAQSMALKHRVILKADGPENLVVLTDRIKLKRIVQNILVNALTYSGANNQGQAMVSVSWSAQGSYYWVLGIQDSGPGLPGDLTEALSEQLRPTVEPTAVLSPDQAEPDQVLPVNIPEIPSSDSLAQMTDAPSHGEGIGLQIVKHLCSMLDATLEVESQQGRGTLFRIRMPVHFQGNI